MIYLDMDGVVVNHFKSFFALFGQQLVESNWPAGITRAKEVLKVAPEVFDERISAAGSVFWAEMEEYPWHRELWEQANLHAPVYYLSSPEYGGGCLSGKLSWLEKRHGTGFDKFIFTQHKTLLARPEAILIDDSPRNLEKFTAAGGRGILFERPWNTRIPSAEPAKKIIKELDHLFREGSPKSPA